MVLPARLPTEPEVPRACIQDPNTCLTLVKLFAIDDEDVVVVVVVVVVFLLLSLLLPPLAIH